MSKGSYYLVIEGFLRAEEDAEGFVNWKFVQDDAEGKEVSVHPIRDGDILKVFDEDFTLAWSGVIAYNYEMQSQPDPDNPEKRIQIIGGKKVRGMSGSARPLHWLQWFRDNWRARLEIRVNDINTHYAEIDGHETDESLPHDRDAERNRLIEDVMSKHSDTRMNGVGKPTVAAKAVWGGKKWWDD